MNKLITIFNTSQVFNFFLKILNFLKENIFMKKNNKSIFDKIFIFSFFRGDGHFQPLYFFVFVFSMLAIVLISFKLYIVWLNIKSGNISIELISSTDIATIVTFVGGILTIYNYNKKNKLQYQNQNKSEEDKG